MSDNNAIRISAEARTALRRAITSHPRWDAYRAAMGYSLATMSRDNYLDTAREFGIDVNAIIRDNGGQTLTTDQPAHHNSGLDPAQFPARGERQPDPVKAVEDAIAAAPEPQAPEFDATDIPSIPLPVSDATVGKIDSLIAIAVDPDVSFRSIYETARRLHHCATSLKLELETATAAAATARDPHAHIVKSSLDFVAPSWSREFLDYLDIGATVAVVGPSGNGKTTGARRLLERAGWTVYEFDCTDATLPQDLIGRTALRQESGATVTEWTAGPIALAFRDPRGAVLLNEYDALDPRTGMALQSALEAAERRRVSAPDTGEQLRAEGPCPIVLTLNTIGHGATVEYQGRNALDGANRDRVEMVVTGYENEEEIIVAHGYDAATARRLAEWAVVARETLGRIGSREILSNRRLLTAAALIDRRDMAFKDAVQRAFIGRMSAAEQTRYLAA